MLLGIAALTKAQTLFIPAVLLATWGLSARGQGGFFLYIGRVVIVYVALMLVILPWTARPNDVKEQVANDRLATSLALRWIHDNPCAFLILIPRKVWRLWAPDGEAEWAYKAGFDNYDAYWFIFRAVRTINQVYYACLIILFIFSSFYLPYRRRRLSPYAATGQILAAYFTAISIVFSGQSRFHLPADAVGCSVRGLDRHPMGRKKPGRRAPSRRYQPR
jgi:hypothetical protein